MELSLDWNNFYAFDEEVNSIEKRSISDAFILCLNNLGKVDIEYIAQISNCELKEVINKLKADGSIYQNPDTWDECFYRGWETSEEYLSGNIFTKLKNAELADNFYNGYFHDNVQALRMIMPPEVECNDIYIIF